MQEKKYIKDSPFIRANISKQKIMALVFISLIPSSIFGIYLFGMNALLVIFSCLITAFLTDIIMQKITKNNFGIINFSSLLTGLIFALILPPTIPFYIASFGTFIAIVLGKYVFGVATNIFNPALVGRIFLVILFPVIMTSFINPFNYSDNFLNNNQEIDAITSATPLFNAQKYDSDLNKYSLKEMFFGFTGGCIGETSAFLLIFAGLFLIFFRVIDYKIPLFYLGSFSFLIFIFNENVLFHLFSGGLIFGAFFMATDYVTSPATKNGKIIFAISLGLLTFLFRIYSSLPEGVMYSILFINALVPLIERYTMPKPFGYKKRLELKKDLKNK
jgi:Na+-translocating ferredoxin:NAD+ oxidoreductase subunit D